MTSEQLAAFERLSASTQERLMLVVQALADGYVGEITLRVSGGRNRSGISFIQWVRNETFKDGGA